MIDQQRNGITQSLMCPSNRRAGMQGERRYLFGDDLLRSAGSHFLTVAQTALT